MTPSMREALKWADQSYTERPPAPLTPSQERALSAFGKVSTEPMRETSLLVA